jgi:hypothetical protein
MSRAGIRLIIVYLCASSTLTFIAVAQVLAQTTDANRQQAQMLWEEAIRAKGGRERLQSIQSFLISSSIDIQAYDGNSFTETERLYAMPGNAWIYKLTPSLDVSLEGLVINNDRNVCTVTFSPANNEIPPVSRCPPTRLIEFLIQDPVIYLMETRWVRPIPISTRTEKKGRRPVNVIETKTGELRADFYLDAKTQLPTKMITDYLVGFSWATMRMGLTIEFSNYVAVDGIQMPRTVTRTLNFKLGASAGIRTQNSLTSVTRRDTEHARYKFNVVYDSTIFDHPIPKKVKRNGWKPQKED